MVAYNFKPRFAQAILSGEKTQTIRAFRTARHAEAGDTMQLYCGMRTKHARQLLEVTCTRNVSCNMGRHRVTVDGVQLDDLDDFARKDGFRNWRELIDFFLEIYELPFSGRLICWKLPDAVR